MIPIIEQQPNGSFEDPILKTFNLGTAPSVVISADGGDEAAGVRPLQFFDYDDDTYGLLYLATATAVPTTRTVKLATSAKSGFNHVWVKQGTVLNPSAGEWDTEIGGATVCNSGGIWILMYDTFNEGKLGLATGKDLLSLEKYALNPVLDNSASVGDFNRYLRHPNINILDGVLYCNYEGRKEQPSQIINSKIGYATAPLNDMFNWTLASEPVIDPIDISYGRGKNNAICNSNIILIDGYYYLWFQAYPPQDNASDFEFGGTSYAYSRDLINWQIIGTENYYVYMGLFGYNSSTSFYHTCQEVTPVYHNGVKSLYMWDLTSTDIGKIELNGESFTNTFRGFTVSDNFNDSSIDLAKWTTGTGTGITLSEGNGKLKIDCDGVGTESGFPVLLESIDSLNNDDGNVICCFELKRSLPTTGDLYVAEISNFDRSDGIRLQRSTTANKIEAKIYENNVNTQTEVLDFNGDEVFKITISGRNIVDIFKGENKVFTHQVQWIVPSFNNTTWTFKIIANNSAGQTISLDNFAFGEYDSGLVATFET